MCTRFTYRQIADYAFQRGDKAHTNAKMRSFWFHVFDVASTFAGMPEFGPR